MLAGVRSWWRGRRERRLEKAAADADGAREGREVWEQNRYLEQHGGARGSGRRTTYDEGNTRDSWS
jgi:hypothetical protein